MSGADTKIPATIITGFLGAGKTTLVRHILANAGGKRIALIINEFGDVGVDRELLSGCGDANCRDDDMIELANGCICCTVADEFIPTMQKLLARKNRPDHILIETSGLALPQPLVRAFNWPEISAAITIDGIIGVLDAAALAAGRFGTDEQAIRQQRESDAMLDHETPLGELFEDQLVCADLLVLNKCDLVEEAELEKVHEVLNGEIRPGTRILETRNADVDVRAVLGLGMDSQQDIANRPSHHEREHDGQPHEHDDFDSFSLALDTPVSRTTLEERIRAATQQHGILRLKGFAALTGSDARLVVQAVGPRVNTWFDRPWQEGEKRRTSLVVIGLAPLDRAAIAATLSPEPA